MTRLSLTLAARRRAFTLVELLVVIAIIGILVALLLPAIQAAREAARRSTCLNSIKNIGLGLQNHLSTTKTFPPGSTGPEYTTAPADAYDKKYAGWAWSAMLLPYLEEQAKFDILGVGKRDVNTALANAQALAVSKSAIMLFACPSEPRQPETISSYGLSQSSYPGVTGAPSRAAMSETGVRGIFASRNVPTRLSKVSDGTSKTMAIGERRIVDFPNTTWVACMQPWTSTSSYAGALHAVGTTAYPLNWSLDAPPYYHSHSFHSSHTGGGHFGFVDGASRFIDDEIDATTYKNLSTMNDGNPVNAED